MFKCTKKGCKKDAVEVVKLHVWSAAESDPGEVFPTIFSCCEKHRVSDGELHQFFKLNWETICVIFEQHKLAVPILEKTEFAWVPIEEYVEFQNKHELAPGQFKQTATVN